MLKTKLQDQEELDFNSIYMHKDELQLETNSNRALAELNTNKSNIHNPARRLESKKDEDEETCEDILTERAEGIKEDMKEKYAEYSNRRFQRSYPITKKNVEGY
jgi:hypothetical protein